MNKINLVYLVILSNYPTGLFFRSENSENYRRAHSVFAPSFDKLVHTESLKQRNRKQELEESSLVELWSVGVDAEALQRQECMERCLGKLSDEDRTMITEYYMHDKAEKVTCRERLAAKLGISLNTLRVKMHRQRLNLELCVNKCLRRYE